MNRNLRADERKLLHKKVLDVTMQRLTCFGKSGLLWANVYYNYNRPGFCELVHGGTNFHNRTNLINRLIIQELNADIKEDSN